MNGNFCGPSPDTQDPRCPFKKPHEYYDVRCPADREYLEECSIDTLQMMVEHAHKYLAARGASSTIRFLRQLIPLKILEEASND